MIPGDRQTHAFPLTRHILEHRIPGLSWQIDILRLPKEET